MLATDIRSIALKRAMEAKQVIRGRPPVDLRSIRRTVDLRVLSDGTYYDAFIPGYHAPDDTVARIVL